MLNEIVIGFTLNNALDLITLEKHNDILNTLAAWIEVADTIAIAAITIKHYYNCKYKLQFFNKGNFVYLQLYKGYSILLVNNSKLH